MTGKKQRSEAQLHKYNTIALNKISNNIVVAKPIGILTASHIK